MLAIKVVTIITLTHNHTLLLDIDECTADMHNCQHICNNNEGSFQCSCNDGYRLQSDGANCSDDDECSLSTHNCEQLCANTAGGFKCECASGYLLNSDKTSCSGNFRILLTVYM